MLQQGAMMSHGGHPGVLPAAAAAAQNPMQPMFPGQIQQPLQGSPMPVSQQQIGRPNAPQQLPMQQPPFLQHMQQRAAPGSIRDDINGLTPQEMEQVSRLAEQMTRKASPADLEKINLSLQNIPPEQKQHIASRGLNNVSYFFRIQALREVKKQKQARIEMAAARAQNALPDGSNNMMSGPMMNAHQRSMSQPMAGIPGNAAIPMSGHQGLDTAFDQIQGQQVDGLRSQEAGQLVVPANSSQMVNHGPYGTQQGLFQGEHAPLNQGNVNPTLLAQQHQRQGVQNIPPEKMSHVAQLQAQKQVQAQARAQAAAKAQMAMSQANSQIPQSLPHQSPAMPTLNRPLGPNQIHQSPQVVPQGSPQSRPPGINSDQNAVPPRPTIPPHLPPAIQERLARMTPEQLTAVFQNNQRRALASQGMAHPNQGPIPMQQSMSDAGQRIPERNGQVRNVQPPGTMAPQVPGASGLLQNQPLPDQHPSAYQRQQSELARLRQIRQLGNGGQDMTEEQIREMDRVHFPQAILNTNANINPPVPKNVKTWGQLKSWVSQNPRVLGDVGISKLQTLQKFHFSQSMYAQRAAANQNVDQNNQSHPTNTATATATATARPQPVVQNPNFPQGQLQNLPAGFPQMRPITPQDIHLARQRLASQYQNIGDEEIKRLLEKNRQKQFLEARNKAHAIALQQSGQAQSTQQTPNQYHQSPPSMTQPPTSLPTQSQSPPTLGNKPSAGKPTRPPSKQSNKNLKRPNNDEVVDLVNSKPQPQAPAPIQPPGVNAAAASSAPTLREQLAAMPPQQKAHIEAQIRRQKGQTPRQPITKIAAEEVWSHLPEEIKKIYDELVKNDTAVAPPVQVTNEQRIQMSQQLRDSTDMIGRMDALVRWVSERPGGQENLLRALLHIVSCFFI